MLYRRSWIGKCISEGTSFNLEEDKQYILRDRSGAGTHYFVWELDGSKFLGCYSSKLFRVIEEVTLELEQKEAEGIEPVITVNDPITESRGVKAGEDIAKPESVKAAKDKPVSKKVENKKPIQKGLFV